MRVIGRRGTRTPHRGECGGSRLDDRDAFGNGLRWRLSETALQHAQQGRTGLLSESRKQIPATEGAKRRAEHLVMILSAPMAPHDE